MDMILMKMSRKLLTDIWMRDGPGSTDHGISCQLKIFKMAATAAIMDIVTKWFSNSESPCHPNASHCGIPILDLGINKFSSSESPCLPNASYQVSAQFDLPWWPPWILERNEFSISKCPSHSNAIHQVMAQFNLPFRSRCGLRFSTWPPWQPSWISEQNDYSHSESLCCPMPHIKF